MRTIELLIFGDITDNCNSIGVEFEQTYTIKNNFHEYAVVEVRYDMFDKMEEDKKRNPEKWCKCWFDKPEETGLGAPKHFAIINHEFVYVWQDEDVIEKGVIPEYRDIMAYICESKNCTASVNASAILYDLAKYNRMKMSDFLKKYYI